MNIVTRVLALLLLLKGILSCNPSTEEKKEEAKSMTTFVYDLTQPAETYVLPKELKEISGWLLTQKTNFCACKTKTVKCLCMIWRNKKLRKVIVSAPGDYEGIEKIGDEIYVLRSDGALFNFKLGNKETREIETGLPEK